MEKEEKNNPKKSWRFCKIKINKDYKYVKKGPIFKIFSNLLYYVIAFPIIKVITKIVYDLKIEGRENLKEVGNGAISISNHVLYLDCAMIGLAFGKERIYFTTIEDNFKIPLVRRIIKLLNAIPIPKSIENKKYFIKAIDNLLKDRKIVHFYPENTLIPYCEEIRELKNGAFDFAIRNKVDVVPIVVTFRDAKGIRRLFKKKKDVTIKILKPIKYEEYNCTVKEQVISLKERVEDAMKKAINV